LLCFLVFALFVPFCGYSFFLLCGKKPKGRFLDRPLKVGGGIQPQLVTVLTPATTFTVVQNFNQNRRAVKWLTIFILKFV